MADGIIPAFLPLRLLNSAEVPDALDFNIRLGEALLGLLVVDHFSLSFGVLDPSSLFLEPRFSHA